jgi:hypothetical protein
VLTKLSEAELISAGAQVRASYLREQAGYTLAIAAAEGPALAANLEDGYLTDTAQCLAEVEAGLKDRTVAESEAALATAAQGTALRAAKVWRRKVAARGARAQRQGESIPTELTVVTRASSVADVSNQITAMIGLFAQHLTVLGKGAQHLLDEGQSISAALTTASTDHDVKRLATLPKSVRSFYALKGTLYTALKVINDAGRELHADSPALSAGYNLKILHRKGHATPLAAGTPTLPAPKPVADPT